MTMRQRTRLEHGAAEEAVVRGEPLKEPVALAMTSILRKALVSRKSSIRFERCAALLSIVPELVADVDC